MRFLVFIEDAPNTRRRGYGVDRQRRFILVIREELSVGRLTEARVVVLEAADDAVNVGLLADEELRLQRNLVGRRIVAEDIDAEVVGLLRVRFKPSKAAAAGRLRKKASNEVPERVP